MAEPRIQYARTSDGVSIAYWTQGRGPALIQMPGAIFGSLGASVAEGQRWGERLAGRNTLVHYDNRGSGQSQRDVSGFSLETLTLDLGAVVDQLGEERPALLGFVRSGPVAIAYAARHPERVSHLVLYGSSARGDRFFESGSLREAMMQLATADWENYTEVYAHLTLGWEEGDLARRYAAILRESTTREALQGAIDLVRSFDVTALLPSLTCPTLVLFRRQVTSPPADESRFLASQIPGAQLIALDGDRVVPYVGDTESVLRAIEEFLGHAPPQPAETAVSLRTILFTDITSSTSLTQELGDAKLHEVRRAHNTIVRDALGAHGGTEIKHTGDGIMASFASASGALDCAVAVQRNVAERADPNLNVHIGLNAGEPIVDERDLFGTSVDLARRVCDEASGGEILASDVVRQLAAGKDFLFSDRGVADLKGFDEPVRLFEVRWRE
jgi:class 3 adenylate cyclase